MKFYAIVAMNILQNTDCYGCGVCAISCPKHIISIRLNEEGFYQPFIEQIDKCIDCGICMDVCAYSYENLSVTNMVLASFAAWSNDSVVRLKCSSGGVGFEIARTLLSLGYEICGVRYNIEQNRAEHYISASQEELAQSMGSKYIQSYTVDGFNRIGRKKKYLITGTPCQIDSFRRYIRRYKLHEENFILMDFFCHGIPSKLLWNRYLSSVEEKTGKVVYASWRDKLHGWHDSWAITIEGEKNVGNDGSCNNWMKERMSSYHSRKSEGDLFYSLFLNDCCLGKACYSHCKYKYDHSAADIRIGDLWGSKYQENEDGVSAVVIFTERGKQILLHTDCVLQNESLGVVAEGQIKDKLSMPSLRSKMITMLRDDSVPLYKIKKVADRYYFSRRLGYYCLHPFYVANRLKAKLFGK